MNSRPLTIGLILISWVNLAGIRVLAEDNNVNAVVSHLVGVMDTTEQVAKNPKRPSVRMTTCEITVKETPENVYLYQEQALTQKLNQPYRQRFLEIKPVPNTQTIESKSYKPLHPENFIGFCDKPQGERIINLVDLGGSVCSVFLNPSPQGFMGETPKAGCPANVRGAVRITNTISLHNQGMDTWDRGYDAQGNQVWGAENESYQYRWVQKTE